MSIGPVDLSAGSPIVAGITPEGFSPVYLEYQPGDYERVFTLSEDIEAARIEASVKNGVLRVFLPKAGPAQTKRIQVRAS